MLYVWLRWVRLTTRRYGVLALVLQSVRKGRHAGVGHGHRGNPLGRAHAFLGEYSHQAPEIIARLRMERRTA